MSQIRKLPAGSIKMMYQDPKLIRYIHRCTAKRSAIKKRQVTAHKVMEGLLPRTALSWWTRLFIWARM